MCQGYMAGGSGYVLSKVVLVIFETPNMQFIQERNVFDRPLNVKKETCQRNYLGNVCAMQISLLRLLFKYILVVGCPSYIFWL